MCRSAFLSVFFLFTLSVSISYFSPRSWALPLPYAQDSNFTLEGKITEKTGSTLTVSSGDNVIFHVVYNDKTDIRKKDGSPGADQDLHSGVTISVAGDLADSGEITAKKIEIE
jgi:hypothetical protein